MDDFHRLAERLSSLVSHLFRRDKRSQSDFSEELEAHLALETYRLREEGLSEEEASALARRNLGNMTKTKERFYEAHRWLWLDYLWQDLRFGFRQLRRSPGFTAVAILTLALGIGASTAIFSVLDPLLLRELPVANPQELMCISSAGTLGNAAQGYSSPVEAYEVYRDHAPMFSGVAAFSSLDSYKLGVGDRLISAGGEIVSGNYFTVLGVQPCLGSFFTRSTSHGSLGNPAVISFGFWQRAFGGEQNALGRIILVNKVPYTIFAVAPRGFFGAEVGQSPDIYLPLGGRLPAADRVRAEWVIILARLKPGVSLSEARAGLVPLFNQIVRGSSLPEVEKRESMARVVVTPASRGLSSLRRRFRLPALILMGVVGLVLLIACANVANLFLAFGASHRREIAVRLALGGGRRRLIRLLLARTALVAAAGALAGLLAARWAGAMLVAALSTSGSQVTLRGGLNARVLAFTVAVTELAVLLAGLVPAFSSIKVNLTEDLKMPSACGFLSPRSRLGKGLLLAQLSICVILCTGTGLLLRTLVKLETLNPGFDRDHVLAVSLHGAGQGANPQQRSAWHRQLLERVTSLPGVRSAAYCAFLPISGREVGVNVAVEGYTLRPGENANTLFDPVSAGYFQTMGIPLVAGRDFRPQDAQRPFRVAIINQTMARRFFGLKNPIGKHFGLVEGNRPPPEIIGIVADSKYNRLQERPQDFFYVPVAYGQALIVRTTGNPGSIAGSLRKEIQLAGGSIEVTRIETLREQIDASLHQERLVTTLCIAFAILALALACIGLYGLLSFSVARRTSEMGIRIALGARPSDIFWLVTGQGVKMTLIGVGLGLIGASVLTRFLSSLLFGVKSIDPLTFVVVSLILIAVALAACYVPARRAASVDPMAALRHE